MNILHKYDFFKKGRFVRIFYCKGSSKYKREFIKNIVMYVLYNGHVCIIIFLSTALRRKCRKMETIRYADIIIQI